MKVFSLCWAVALFAQVTSAATCPTTGDNAPAVTTLFQSKTKPATDAWVVSSDCSVATSSLSDSADLTLQSANVERIASVPADVKTITFTDSPLSSGADFSKATKLIAIYLYTFAPSLLNSFALPSNLEILLLQNSALKNVNNLALPSTLQRLFVKSAGLESFSLALPPTLIELSLEANALTSINFPLPAHLEQLTLSRNPIGKITGVTLPNTLITFECDDCAITSIRGVKWSSSLQNVKLWKNSITDFELRQSDFAVFSKLKFFHVQIAQTKCSDPTATIATIASNNICVITDARFESLYSGSNNNGGGNNGTDACWG